jgi:hypothetical protein
MDYLLRHLRELRQNSRTAQDDDLIIPGNIAGGPDYMFKL